MMTALDLIVFILASLSMTNIIVREYAFEWLRNWIDNVFPYSILNKLINPFSMNDNHFKFSPSVILIPFLSVVLLWFVFWIDVRFHFNFDQFGIYPR